MNRTDDELKLEQLCQNPRTAKSCAAFTMILPTSPQVATPNREFLLQTPIEGVSSIATVAKLAGWDVKIRDLRIGEDMEEACHDAAGRGGIVAMPTFADSFPVNERVLARVKELNPEIITLVGGALVSSLPELIVRNLGADYAILREGEVTLLDLLDHLASGGTREGALQIPGLAILSEGSVHLTSPRKQLKDLDVVPIPDLSLYPGIGQNSVLPELGLTTSRGCYGRCSFCFLNMEKLSYKTPERFEQEVRQLKERHKIRYFYLNDLTFTSNLKRSYQICDVLRKHDMVWSCSTRVEQIQPELLKYMHEAGCRDIWYGVESLDQTILDLANKRTRVEEIEYAITETVRAGIQVMANLIVGLPGESERSLRKMIDFCKRNDVTPASIKYLTPFPGTELYEMAVQRGLIKDPIEYLRQLASRKVNDAEDAIINLTELPEQRLRAAYRELMELRQERLERL